MSTSAKSSAKRHPILTILVTLIALAATPRVARPAEVNRNIDYENFLKRHDLVWNKVPEKWGEGAFTGNGLLGLMMYLTDDGSALRFRVGRTDVMIQEKQAYRVPIGDLVLRPVGKITGGEFRQDLWNAEVRGVLKTDRGQIRIRFFTHANDLVNVIEIKPSQIEQGCKWEFQPGVSANPRWIRDKQPIPEDEQSPPPVVVNGGAFSHALQKVFNGDEYATVWQEWRRSSDQRIRGPVQVPPWFRESRAFKSWQRRHNSQTLRTRDDFGNIYEIYCSSAVNRGGTIYEWLPTVRMYRPDGTLAAQASYNEAGQPAAWAEYGSTGKKKVFSVDTNGIAITDVPPPIMLVAFYDEQDNQRVWHVGSKDPTLVQVEMLNNPIGEKVRVLHAVRELKKKPATTTTTTKMTTRRAK